MNLERELEPKRLSARLAVAKSASLIIVVGHISPRSSLTKMWPVSSNTDTISGSWASIQAVHLLQCFRMISRVDCKQYREERRHTGPSLFFAFLLRSFKDLMSPHISLVISVRWQEVCSLQVIPEFAVLMRCRRSWN